MKKPKIFGDFLHHSQPLRYIFVVFFQHLELIKYVVEYELNDLDVLEFARLLDQFLNRSQETFLLVFTDGNWKKIFDIFQLSVQDF